MKMRGMTARSDSLSAVNCDASFVKTDATVSMREMLKKGRHTKTRREQLRVEIGKEFLVFGVELAHPGDNVAWQAHADDLHNRLKDQQSEVGEIWMRAVLLLEDLHEAVAPVVVGLGAHGDEVC